MDVAGLALQFLVMRCQAGDERAFESLLSQFGERTHRYLSGLIGDAADDVQQEVWLTVYRRLRELANPAAFRTWLFRVTRHRALDHLRRERRHDAFLADVAAASPAVVAPDEDETISLSGTDAAAAMAALSPAHREVLVLRYQDDLSYTEIAVVVGCSVGTVRSRLHHAKARLAELLRPTT